MPRRTKAPHLETSDLFPAFEQACRTFLAFLENEHGITLTQTQRAGYEFVVTFESPTLRVVATLEFPAPPWIVVEACRGGLWKRSGLSQLAKRIGRNFPKRELQQADPSPSDLFRILKEDANFLRTNWNELLEALV